MNSDHKNIFYIIGASVLVVLAIIGGLWWFNSTRDNTPADSIATSLGQTTVTVLEPGVFVKGTDATADKEITDKEVMTAEQTQGLTIKTNAKGRALIQSKSGTLTLDHDSEITIESLEIGKTSATLAVGSVWSQVEKIFEQGEFYEIKTQNAVASVRGTSFGVINDKSTTAVLVSEGKVKANPKNQKTGEQYDNKGALVDAGKKAIIKADLSVIVLPLSKTDLESDFYLYNNKDDSEDKTDEKAAITTQVDTKATITVKPTTSGPVVVPRTTPTPTQPTGSTNSSGNTSSGSATAPVSFGITGFSPRSLSARSQTEILTINGNGFKDVKAVYIGQYSLDYDIISETTITTAPPNSITPGSYQVIVVNGAGERKVAPGMLEITQ